MFQFTYTFYPFKLAKIWICGQFEPEESGELLISITLEGGHFLFCPSNEYNYWNVTLMNIISG